MRRLLLTGLFLCLADEARAQFGYQRPRTGYTRPAVSPYLNLNRAGVAPGVNYQALVRPQFETYGQLQGLQQGFQTLQQQQAGTSGGVGVPPASGVTGFGPRFFYYSHYYTFPAPKFGPGSGNAGGLTPTAPFQPSVIQRPAPPGIGVIVGIGGNKD